VGGQSVSLNMYSLLQDIRFSFRLMRKHPGMSFLVLAALVLGIGVNSAVFSVVNAVLLRPVPLFDPERVVFIYAKSQQSSAVTLSYPEYQDWKAQSRSFQEMAAWQAFYLNLIGNGPPEHLKGMGVSASYFKSLGISPAKGRDFTKDDELPGAARVAIISHGLWQRRFGADPAILGKTIVLDTLPYTVVGVLPPSQLVYVQFWDVWVGIGPFLDEHMMNRETRYFGVIGRLAPSVNLAQAQAEMETIASRLAAQYPLSNKDISVNVVSLVGQLTTNDRKPLCLILIASNLILLLACVNVVTVFVASAIERRKELSIRMALGAARSIVLRQLFVQGLMCAVAGAFLGLATAKAGLALLTGKFPFLVTRFQETTMDSSVIWFTICTAIGCTLLASIVPGLYAMRLNINSELKGEWSWTALSKYRVVGQSALIAFEVALAVSLSLVSGLLIKSFHEVAKVDLGFNPHNVLSFQVSLPRAHYKDEPAKTTFYRQVIQNLKAIPGVQSASATYTLPSGGGTHFINLQVDSDSPLSSERPFVDSTSVLPDFFTSMKISMLQGRDFTDTDRAGALPVAIVDEVLAARMWPGQSALGKHLRLADITDSRPPWREIVGVVRQIKYFGPERKVARLQVYVPTYQVPTDMISFVMETMTPAATLKASAEKAVHDVDLDLPLDNFRTLDDYLDQVESGRRVSVLLLSSFAGVGIVLGMIGIYGVVSNSVVRRRREIAIRMALGASVPTSIFLVVRVALLATFVGITIGSVIVVGFTGLFSAFLFGVKALDPGIYALSAVTIIVLALVASLVPAAALLRLNPQDILRQ
jgi:putative ABC transport system permease protein